jgi:hypothetical protein
MSFAKCGFILYEREASGGRGRLRMNWRNRQDETNVDRYDITSWPAIAPARYPEITEKHATAALQLENTLIARNYKFDPSSINCLKHESL